jgi:hypothetical protein
MALKGKYSVRSMIVACDEPPEQVNDFSYLGRIFQNLRMMIWNQS